MIKLIKTLLHKSVSDVSENRRLAISYNERPLREGFNKELYADILTAKEQLFQETVEIKKLPPSS